MKLHEVGNEHLDDRLVPHRRRRRVEIGTELLNHAARASVWVVRVHLRFFGQHVFRYRILRVLPIHELTSKRTNPILRAMNRMSE